MGRALTLVLILVVCIPAFAQGQAPAVTSADAAKRADSYTGRMSPEQKIDYIGGTGFAVRAIPELGVPALEIQQSLGCSGGGFGDGAQRPEGALYRGFRRNEHRFSRRSEVAQVYVGEAKPSVPRPAKELKGFSRVELAAGETKHVTMSLDARALAFYDVAGKHWQADAEAFSILVGARLLTRRSPRACHCRKPSASARRSNLDRNLVLAPVTKLGEAWRWARSSQKSRIAELTSNRRAP